LLSHLATIIPLGSTSSAEDPVYSLDPDIDADLLKEWHDHVLPRLTATSSRFFSLISMHLIRQGLTEEQSLPTILVSVKPGANQDYLRNNISCLFEEISRPLLRISFEEESLRRTINDGLPPICEARNAQFHTEPVSDRLRQVFWVSLPVSGGPRSESFRIP
jgi:hypothetical protein